MTRFAPTLLSLLLTASTASSATSPPAQPLRVCADPNNMPWSNERREGFENALADLVARELGRSVEYTWRPQRRGFLRETLNAGACDVVLGVPAGDEMLLKTRPYYRSTYVFVTRAEDARRITSLDDPALRTMRIGVHLIGDDASNTPPAHALAKRGIINNVVGYTIYGDYTEANPPAGLIEAVVRGDVDVAIAWGPLAGYFARNAVRPLTITPVSPQQDGPLAFSFAIAAGVRKDDRALKDQVERALNRRSREVRALLLRYGVPLVEATR